MRTYGWQRRLIRRAGALSGDLPLSEAAATFATTLAIHLLNGGVLPDIAPTHEIHVDVDSPNDDDAGRYVRAVVVPIGTGAGESQANALTDQWHSRAIPEDDDAHGEAWDEAIDAELDTRHYLRVGPTLARSPIAIIPIRALPYPTTG